MTFFKKYYERLIKEQYLCACNGIRCDNYLAIYFVPVEYHNQQIIYVRIRDTGARIRTEGTDDDVRHITYHILPTVDTRED